MTSCITQILFFSVTKFKYVYHTGEPKLNNSKHKMKSVEVNNEYQSRYIPTIDMPAVVICHINLSNISKLI